MGKSILLTVISLFLSLQSYAIQVSVRANSSAITGLGFSVEDTAHGAEGQSYVADGEPIGVYRFGIRVNGLFGTNVPCYVNGQPSVMLNRSVTAVLNYNNDRCVAKIYRR